MLVGIEEMGVIKEIRKYFQAVFDLLVHLTELVVTAN
jgi:hypothetical protein